MGNLNLEQINRLLRLVGLEQIDGDRVKVVPTDHESAVLKGPPHRLIGTEARSEYVVSQTPELVRALRPFFLMNAAVCGSTKTLHACHLRLLKAVREEMQSGEIGKDATHGRILTTMFYWSLVKAIPLSEKEAQTEAFALSTITAVRRNGTSQADRESSRNAELALGVLIETRPPRERASLNLLLHRQTNGTHP